MSFLVSDSLQDANQQLNLVGQRMSTLDWLLFLNNANKYFQTNYKMPTTERTADFFLFKGVYEYGVPSDFAGMLEPERPYGFFSPNFSMHTQKELVNTPDNSRIAFKFDRETQFLIITAPDTLDATLNPNQLMLNKCDSLTDDGTITVAGDSSSAILDGQLVTEGSNSLKFSVIGATGSTTLTFTGMVSKDITDYDNAFEFLDIYNPNVTPITSVTLRFGQDNANYYESTSPYSYRGDTIGRGYSKIGFDSRTSVGSPTKNITWMEIVVNHGIVSGDFRIDNVFITNPVYFTLPYYSTFNVKTQAGVYQVKTTDVSDTILCPPDCDEAYTYKALEQAAVLKLRDGELANYFRGELFPKEAQLRSKYPSQEPRVQNTYYKKWR
jgi:hypothetical protein